MGAEARVLGRGGIRAVARAATTWPLTPAGSTSAPTTTPPLSRWSRSATALFNVRPETINRHIRQTRQLLQQAEYTIQPGPHRLATLDDLHSLATAEGITTTAEITTACLIAAARPDAASISGVSSPSLYHTNERNPGKLRVIFLQALNYPALRLTSKNQQRRGRGAGFPSFTPAMSRLLTKSTRASMEEADG
jgi:hypothetical protein